MMTSGPDVLLISDFKQKAIDSIEYARSNKDAVFCSIFDMNEITNTCNSYKSKFAHNIQILPGLRTARILGTTIKENSGLQLKKPLSYTQRIVKDPNVVEQHQKRLAILQAEIINSQQELNKAQATLEKLQEFDQEAVLGAKIKKLKDRFKSLLTRDERESTWHDMKCLKEERNQHRIEIINCRSLILSLKQDLYRKRIAIQFDKAIQEQVKRSGQEKRDGPIKISSQTTGVFNATDCLIDGTNDFTFSGADNGLVNLSTSVPFTSQRF